MVNELHIFRKLTTSGVEIKVRKKKYELSYPRRIWKKFPKPLHKIFADSLSYLATWHLPLIENGSLVYHFSHPIVEPIIFKILLYSIASSVFQKKEPKNSELIRNFFNYNSQTRYKALNYNFSGKKLKKSLKERAILLFSFGKDSLLTYGLLDELGVGINLFFMKEPQCAFENSHKKKLADRFYKKFKKDVSIIPLSFGRLRQEDQSYWGWDILLSQYVFVLIPYLFYHQAKYIFLGNEQSCNYNALDDEGYLVNPVYEQSVAGMQLLQEIPKHFSINTHLGSLVEPIHEIFISYILHHRYPDIGRFQMSCFSDDPEAKKSLWCGNCEKCARMYIFFKALGVDPEKIGFRSKQMLNSGKKDLYAIFGEVTKDSAYGGSGLGRDEQLLAFLLAYKNGTKGELIDQFAELYLDEAEKRKDKLVKEFFGIHTSYSLPSSLRKKTIRIFEKEQVEALEYVNKLLVQN
ncbi:MAG: hypothetical protein WC841_04840 [Candidatus Shapirobacteria bacterium]|jgi:hypothetical protein